MKWHLYYAIMFSLIAGSILLLASLIRHEIVWHEIAGMILLPLFGWVASVIRLTSVEVKEGGHQLLFVICSLFLAILIILSTGIFGMICYSFFPQEITREELASALFAAISLLIISFTSIICFYFLHITGKEIQYESSLG